MPDSFVTDRTWALPAFPAVMRMQWLRLLFAHWPMEPAQIAAHLPAGLTLDTFDGHGWVGVVPFEMADVAPRGVPAVPGLSRFPELNVRTYVRKDDKPGVWFFSLDAASRVAVRVARAVFHLPYMDARMSLEQQRPVDPIHYTSLRTHRHEPRAQFRATYAPTGPRFHASPGSLEHWLTARYCLYSRNRQGHLFRGEINHPPWTLRTATCEWQENTMGEPWGFDFDGEAHLLAADPLVVRAWWPTRCS